VFEFFTFTVDLHDPDRKSVIDHGDFTLCHKLLAYKYVNRLACHAVKLDDTGFFEIEQLADGHSGLSELDADEYIMKAAAGQGRKPDKVGGRKVPLNRKRAFLQKMFSSRKRFLE
jgi:hypothetical protein